MGDEKFKDSFKILVLGAEGVGKTTLIEQYSDEIFEKDVASVVGVNFYIKHIEFDEHNYKLQFWDFFDEDKFGSVHSLYYKGASAIIFIFDLSKPETFDLYEKYLNKVWDEGKVNKCPVILVGNKLDLVEKTNEINRKKYFDTVRQEGFLGYIETSMDNIEDLRKQIPNIILSTLRKTYQVKFLVNCKEFDNIKRYSKLSNQKQSEFIRSAIRDKIKAIKAESININKERNTNKDKNKLKLKELEKIRRILEKLED